MTVHVSTCPYIDKDSGAKMIGTGVSRYTTAPNLCHTRVTLESSVDHTPDRALSFVTLDLGQTRGAASLVFMLSHIHVRSISLDVTPSPLTLTLTFGFSLLRKQREMRLPGIGAAWVRSGQSWI